MTEGSSNITQHDYLAGGFQYKLGNLEFFPHAEGYVNATRMRGGYMFNYVFNYTDHLGNIRVSYGIDPSTATLKIIEDNHYYPFGLKHTNYNSDIKKFVKFSDDDLIVLRSPTSSLPTTDYTDYKYKYNGKEFQDELGLNMYDYGARNYDPAIGRWMNIDPLAELMRRHSPYNYAFNNPVYFIDPDGMSPEGSNPNGGWFSRAWNSVKSLFSSSSGNNNGSVEVGEGFMDFFNENEFVANIDFGLDFVLGAGISVKGGGNEISANGQLVGVELIEVNGNLLDVSSFEGDVIFKDNQIDVSQSINVSVSDKNSKLTLVEGENSFTAYGKDYDKVTNQKTSFDYLSKTTSSLAPNNEKSTKGTTVTTTGPGDKSGSANANIVTKGDSSTIKVGVKGGVILKIGLSLDVGFKKRK